MTDNQTTELREKLTERGVEYTTNDHLGAYETSWDGFTAMQLTPGAKLMMVFTPEQAIAATLGNSRAERTCRSTTDDNAWCFVCSECGKSFPRSKLHLAHNHGEINYCPNCGARRVGE